MADLSPRNADDGVLPAPAYLATLNPPQREAVETVDGPLLVLAGAGTGKTRVLTTRLAHLLVTRRAAPWQILAVTFTNKAAREMRDRVARLTGDPAEGWWLGTFHALAARILRRHAEIVGLKPNFTILDTDDQLRLVKQLLEAENIDGKRWPARLVLGTIERWKDRGLTPGQLKPDDAGDIAGGRMVALYTAYQDRMRTLNACDFGDLLLHNLAIFERESEVAARWQRRFAYILVDEYQDTNVAQYLWLRLLAMGHRNICCVGDDDQSIYGWRGAEVGNILRFESDFPGAKVVRLEQNYRSTGHILAAASGLIAHNKGRLGKTLYTTAEAGDHVVVRAVWDAEEEARWIGEEIEALQRRKVELAGMAVLVRAGFQMRAFEERFIALGLPYRVVGGPRFYERMEIRDAIAYLRLIAQPDDDLAFERIFNTPRRGLGDAALRTLHQEARTGPDGEIFPLGDVAWGLSHPDQPAPPVFDVAVTVDDETGEPIPVARAAAPYAPTRELAPRARNSLRRFTEDLARWRAMVPKVRHPELAQIVLDESGYTAMWQNDKSPDAPGRLDNLKELVAAMEEFESLHGFLEHVSLVMDNTADTVGDQLTLMTLHSAKGLEFDHVFLPGWEEGLFPSQRSVDEGGIAALEEERRLAYVGLTRARQRAYVVSAANRQIHGQWQSSLPSRFLDELPQDDIEVQGDTGLGAAVQTPAFRLADVRLGGFMRRPAQVIDGDGYVVQERPRPERAFAVGDRVFHQKFGYGSVRAADNDKLTIDFDHAGEKKVIDSFVVAADQAG